MPLHYRRLPQETETYKIAKTGKPHDRDSLPNKYELVAQIDTNLKHLQGQQKILQNAKYCKTRKHKFSLNENRNKKNQETSMSPCKSKCNVSYGHICDVLRKIAGNKSIKVTDSYTQIGSSLNNLNKKRNCRISRSRNIHKYRTSIFDQNVHLRSDETALNNELKIYKNRSPVRKINSKTQTKVLNKYSIGLLSPKQKIFVFTKPSSESRQLSSRLGSEACDRFHDLTKLQRISNPPEISSESHTFQNVNNLPKASKAKSIYAKNSNLPEFSIAIRSPRTDKLRKHAKLSKEILDYTKYIKEQRTSQGTNEEKPHTKKKSGTELQWEAFNRSIQPSYEAFTRDSEISEIHQNSNLYDTRTNFKQNVSIHNHDTFIILNSEKSHNKEKYRREKTELSTSKNNNLAETSRSKKSQNISTIKPSVIDDSTYVCPDNSEENNYLLLPYVGDTSENIVNLNLSSKPERPDLYNRDSDIEGITSKSAVVLDDMSSHKSSKPSRSIKNESKTRTNRIKNGFSQNAANESINREQKLSQRSYKTEYLSHNLESTWESHANREGPFSSKFKQSHNYIKIPTGYQSHYYNLKDHQVQSFSKRSLQRKNDIYPLYSPFNSNSVHTDDILKTLRSHQSHLKERIHDRYPTKLASQKEEEMHATEFSKNNKTTTCSQLQNQIVNRSSHSSGSIILMPKSAVKDKRLQQDRNQNTISENGCFETTTNLNESSSILSWTHRKKLSYSDYEIQETVTTYDGASEKDTYKDQMELGNDLQIKCSPLAKEMQLNMKSSQVFQKNELAPTPKDSELLGRDLSLPAKPKKDIVQKPQRSESKMNASTGDICLKCEHNPTHLENASQESVTRRSDSNCELNNFELGSNSKISSNENVLKSTCKTSRFSLTGTPNNDRKPLPSVEKIKVSAGNISFTHKTEQTSHETTSNANQAGCLKSTSFPSLVCSSKLNPIANGNVFDDKLKLRSTLSNFQFQSKANESRNSEKSPSGEPKIYPLPDGIPLQFEPEKPSKEETPKAHKSDEKKTHGSKHIADIEFSKTFRSILDGSELGAIPKLKVNENKLAFKSISNENFLSTSDLSEMFKSQDVSQKPPHSNNATEKMFSKLETSSPKEELDVHFSADGTSETNNKSDAEVSTSSRLKLNTMKEQNRFSISSDFKELESPTTCKKILSQQSNKSSGSQYLELFWNNNDAVKNIFRTSASKFKPKLNFSSSSKSSHDLINHKTSKILQATSSTVLISDKLKASGTPSPRIFGTIPAYGFNTEKRNEESIEQNIGEIDKCNIFNRFKSRTPDSEMPLSFPSPEESPTVSFKSKSSTNKLNENFSHTHNCSLYRDKNRLNETEGNAKIEKHIFLSDTFKQNISVEGVSPELSDLIQHLHNRVRDCDENVKNQSEELEKLKRKCKTVELSTPIAEYGEKEKKPKEHLKSIVINEPLIREDKLENNIRKENSCDCCDCLFCGQENSTSYSSEEIPPFTGCECMKDDYYKIMRIAYNR